MKRILALVLVLLALTAPDAFARKHRNAWNRALPKTRATSALEKVLAEVKRQKFLGKKPIVVIDIDDTAVDGRNRLRVAAQRAGLTANRRTYSGDDLYRNTAAGARDAKRKTFNSHYFDDPKLAKLDHPQAGAIAFAKAIQKAGGRVVFSSGRWETTRKTTEPWLKKLGFPLVASTDLKLNANPDQKAAEHKVLVAKQLKKEGTIVAFFDNEIQSVRDYHRIFPKARGFRLRTFSFKSDEHEVPKNVSVIRDFSQ